VTAPDKFSSVSIFGGGAWGTALAALAARNGVPSLLWTRNIEDCDAINTNAENTVYLPGITLPEGLRATTDLSEALQTDAFITAIPAQHCRAAFESMAEHTRDARPVAIASKGIERTSLMLMHEVLRKAWPAAHPAILSGPSFAHDVASGQPTAVTLADSDAARGSRWVETIGTRNFRPYLSLDLTGVALGGSVKNVLAIAAGIVDGLGLGQSAHAALIARGFAEFQRLGMAMGAKSATMTGLSGLGDLILTGGSTRSRNMSLGQQLGKGLTLNAILKGRNSVSEGVASAQAVCGLARRHGVEMPVSQAVDDIIAGKQSVAEAISALTSRPFKSES